MGKTWTIGTSRDVIVHASPKGYINKDIFFEYAECWVQYLRRKSRLDKTNIHLLDAHKSHIYNLKFIRLMVENNIEVLAIPAHRSHVIQPLDFTSVGCKMLKQDFWLVFWLAWKKSMTTAAIQSGFRRTGIFPFNPHAIKPSDLGPSTTTDNIANLAGKETFGNVQNCVLLHVSEFVLELFSKFVLDYICKV